MLCRVSLLFGMVEAQCPLQSLFSVSLDLRPHLFTCLCACLYGRVLLGGRRLLHMRGGRRLGQIQFLQCCARVPVARFLVRARPLANLLPTGTANAPTAHLDLQPFPLRFAVLAVISLPLLALALICPTLPLTRTDRCC